MRGLVGIVQDTLDLGQDDLDDRGGLLGSEGLDRLLEESRPCREMRLRGPALEEMAKAGGIERRDDLRLDLGDAKPGLGLPGEVAELGGNDLDEGEPSCRDQRFEDSRIGHRLVEMPGSAASGAASRAWSVSPQDRACPRG